jgi:glycosyltransferase involved in cell wall biosynthesis
MKILQVIDKLEVGGAERVAVDLCSILYKNNVEVDFLNLLKPSELDQELLEKGIKVHYLNRENKFNPIYLIKMLLLLNQYSIIHVHSRHVLRYVGLTFFLPRIFRKYKVIFHDHFGEIEHDKFISPYLRKCINNCAAYVGVSPSLVSWAKENQLNRRVFLLENIVVEKDAFRKIATESKIVVVGNFRKQKNYEFLLSVLKNLPEPIKIDLYGTIVDRKYYDEIVNLAKSHNLFNRITIKTREKNISEILLNYKFAVHCAASETGPLVAIEYMSKGIPFIMFNTGAVAKVLKENEYDFIMDIFDEEMWSKKIMEVMANSSKQSYLSKQLRILYRNFFSEKIYLEKCLKIYQNIQNS